MPPAWGSFVAVGTGIRAPAHVTAEAAARITHAQMVFVLVADPLTEHAVRSISPNVESLAPLYEVGKPRVQSDHELVARIVDRVRSGSRVCAASYGHPGVFAYALHAAVREVRAAGARAEMLPAVAAEDCLLPISASIRARTARRVLKPPTFYGMRGLSTRRQVSFGGKSASSPSRA